MSQDRKAQAEQLFKSGETIAAIARQLNISRRTVERWADEGAWREQRGVVKFQRSNAPREPRPLEPIPASDDDLQTVVEAIASVKKLLDEATPGDLRGIGTLITGLCRLIELKLRLRPRTAAELAEQAIALGYTPERFLVALNEEWRKQA